MSQRALQFRDTTYPVVLPRLTDSRLHIASVIISLHVLGQTVLNFEVSIAQILIALGTSAILEATITFVRTKSIVWPASAMLTGNGVAFILRVPGTQHGDWWSTRGWWIYAGTAAVSLLSKYALRRNGSHIFNPSNFGLVLCFLILGSSRAEPLDFWWGPMSFKIAVALGIISAGGLIVLTRLKLLRLALTFWATFAAGMVVLAFAGHCMTARWHLGPVCGRAFATALIWSPELLVFLCFMITDPRTIPLGVRAQRAYAVFIAVAAALFIAPQRTEFATKVSLLVALALACAVRPIFDRYFLTPDPHMPPSNSSGVRALDPSRTIVSGVTLIAILVAALALLTEPNRDLDVAQTKRASVPSVDAILNRNQPLPNIVINNTDLLASRIDRVTAETIGRDVVDNLDIITAAFDAKRADYLTAAAAESWLTHLRTTMATAPAEQYSLDRITISLARRPGQGVPAVLVTLRGTAHSKTSRSVNETYEVKYLGGRYVLTTDKLPPGFVVMN